eukprot:107343_1
MPLHIPPPQLQSSNPLNIHDEIHSHTPTPNPSQNTNPKPNANPNTFAQESELSASELSGHDLCVLEDIYIEKIRELGKYHQEIFANEICDAFVNLNDRETVAESRNTFGKIRQNFADEASEEFMELNEYSDIDYDENDLKQVQQDEWIDKKQKLKLYLLIMNLVCHINQ